MSSCARCKCELGGNSLICRECFTAWVNTKGSSLEEYLNKPYDPPPVKYNAGHSTCEDCPP